MKGYRPIYICVGFAFIANMTGCVTTPSVWQKTQEFNKLAVYQDSLLKTPLRESAYVPKRRLNQFTLRKVAKQNQMLEGRRQLGRANQEKIIHLKHYTVNSLTEDQFLADGWDLCNSYRLALGIVGRLSFDISGHSAIRAEYSANLVASRRGLYSIYWIGVDRRAQLLASTGLSPEEMIGFSVGSNDYLMKKSGNVYLPPSHRAAQLICKLTFIDRSLAEINWED